MSRFYFFLLLLIAFLGKPSAKAQTAPPAKIIQGKLVFKLKPGYKSFATGNTLRLEKLTQLLVSLNATGLEQKYPKTFIPSDQPDAVDLSLIYQVKLNGSISLQKTCDALLKTGLLEYAELLRQFGPLYQPNDPMADSLLAGNQYHLKNIKAYKGWDLEKGDSTIVIGILDT